LGELVFTIGNILFRDVTRWLLLAMILIVAVLCLMVGLISFQREGAKDGTSNLMSYSEEPVNYKVIAGPIFGDPDWDIVFEPQLHLNSAAVFTYFLYTFIISVVLVNLLIAMMADSFERTRARTQAQFALARAQGILQLLSLPAFGLSRNRPPHHAWVGGAWTMLLQELNEHSEQGVLRHGEFSEGASVSEGGVEAPRSSGDTFMPQHGVSSALHEGSRLTGASQCALGDTRLSKIRERVTAIGAAEQASAEISDVITRTLQRQLSSQIRTIVDQMMSSRRGSAERTGLSDLPGVARGSQTERRDRSSVVRPFCAPRNSQPQPDPKRASGADRVTDPLIDPMSA